MGKALAPVVGPDEMTSHSLAGTAPCDVPRVQRAERLDKRIRIGVFNALSIPDLSLARLR